MRPATDEIVGAARAWLGTPYRHQASTLGAGCDCLGLLRGVWRALYGSEPAVAPNYRADMRDPLHAGGLLETTEMFLVRAGGEPAAGQVVLFRLIRTLPPKHCGIMVSATRFIHAQERLGVVEVNLTDGWRRRVTGVFAFPEMQLSRPPPPCGEGTGVGVLPVHETHPHPSSATGLRP